MDLELVALGRWCKERELSEFCGLPSDARMSADVNPSSNDMSVEWSAGAT